MDLLRSLPLGLYLEEPVTWLHKLDPRVKFAWLMTFLAAPILANVWWRITLVLLLILLTIIARIPLRAWRKQLGLLLMFFGLVFVVTCIAPDGMALQHQQRLPSDELNPSALVAPSKPAPWYNPFSNGKKANSPEPLPQPTDYNYVLLHKGKVKITRRSLNLALRISTIFPVLIYSTTLYLLTTAPEEITAGLENLLQPLERYKVPVTEIILTLTLSLRFIPLVLEEIQNLSRSITTRGIDWKKLGIRRSLQIWLIVSERLLANLLMRAEQIALAMDVRGFTSPNQHHVKWHKLRIGWRDWLALGCIVLFWGARFVWGGIVP